MSGNEILLTNVHGSLRLHNPYDVPMTITLFDFSQSATARAWQAIDDRVMGGVSQSRLRVANGHAVFEGTVSDRHNGGFASVRASVTQPVSDDALEHLWISTCGSNVVCYINLRMNDNFDGVSFRASFTVNSEWRRVELPFSEFQPVFRGRPVTSAPEWTSTDIHQVGLMIANRQLGVFTVRVGSIGLGY
ncbi:MAG: CIA30 family protein [Granulosicoccus sp.]